MQYQKSRFHLCVESCELHSLVEWLIVLKSNTNYQKDNWNISYIIEKPVQHDQDHLYFPNIVCVMVKRMDVEPAPAGLIY